MWIRTIPATHTDPEESELMEEPGEAQALFIQEMLDNQEVVETVYALDDYTEEDIELAMSDYFSSDIWDLPRGKLTKDQLEGCCE